MNKQPATYSTNATKEVATFLDAVTDRKEAGDTTPLLDSIKNESSSIKLPAGLDALMGKVGGDAGKEKMLLDSVTLGLERFKYEHGTYPTADVVEAAIQQGRAAYENIGPDGSKMLDAIINTSSSTHSDPMSLQSNRAVVAILSGIAEAIPFAGYLPVDLGSNQSKLAVLSHIAGSTYGDYASGAIMDGVNGGLSYASSNRALKFDITQTFPLASKFTTTNLAGSPGFCNPAGTGFAVLRGRSVLYVNGKVAARDQASGSGATSPMSGTVVLAGVTYTATATITIATGVVSLAAFSPTLPVGTEVIMEAYVDYEVAPSLIPLLQVRADTFDIYANPWRAMTNISIDASTQLRNELGLDGSSEAIMAMRTQMSQERHFLALRKAASLGLNNVNTFDFQWTARSAQMNRAQIWQDLQAKMGVVDQKMANDTMDHGVTHYYVSSFLANIMLSLGSDMFEPSGVTVRPGIFRVGRLFKKYDIYYTPSFAAQATDLSTASMIGIGRSSQVARCPIMLGDAVSPTFLDLARNSDLKQQAAIYARDFTEVNPHEQSALGCAVINLTNLG